MSAALRPVDGDDDDETAEASEKEEKDGIKRLGVFPRR